MEAANGCPKEDHYMKLIISSCPLDKAELLAEKAVTNRLAACVSILPNMRSIYWWQDKIEKETEALLLIKTEDALAAELSEKLREWHPYDVPEILCLDVESGNPDYFAWAAEVLRKP